MHTGIIDLTDAWSRVAAHCFSRGNVIGYDLINEPSSDADTQLCWNEIPDACDAEGVEKLGTTYLQILRAITKIDPITPILLEPPFWAHALALPRLEPILQRLEEFKSQLLLSFHFYEPMRYTQRRHNQGKYSYPCDVPLYLTEDSPTIRIDDRWIKDRFATSTKWADDKSWAKIVIGEAGVTRDVPGAVEYLKDTLKGALDDGLPVFLFSFRDAEWEAMNYEKGTQRHGGSPNNELMNVIKKAIQVANLNGSC